MERIKSGLIGHSWGKMTHGIDTDAIMDWIDNGCKPQSNIAFTDGPDRKCAWLIEYALREMKKCHNGDSCYISAPRGSRTGTQGMTDSRERAIIPRELFIDIFQDIGNKISKEI